MDKQELASSIQDTFQKINKISLSNELFKLTHTKNRREKNTKLRNLVEKYNDDLNTLVEQTSYSGELPIARLNEWENSHGQTVLTVEFDDDK